MRYSFIDAARERAQVAPTSCRQDMVDHVDDLVKLLRVMDEADVHWGVYGSFVDFALGRVKGFADIDVCATSGDRSFNIDEAALKIGLNLGYKHPPPEKNGGLFDVYGNFNRGSSWITNGFNSHCMTRFGYVRNPSVDVVDGVMSYDGMRPGTPPIVAVRMIRYATRMGLKVDPWIFDQTSGDMFHFVEYVMKCLGSSSFGDFMSYMDCLGGWRTCYGYEPFEPVRSRMVEAPLKLRMCHHGTFWRYVMGEVSERMLVDLGFPAHYAAMIASETSACEPEVGDPDEVASERIVAVQFNKAMRIATASRAACWRRSL